MVCSQCGLVVNNCGGYEKIDGKTDSEKELIVIKMKIDQILNDCLPMLNIHKNVEKTIRKKMLTIIRRNKDIGKLKHVESVVMTLMVYAIRELKIPLNKQKLNKALKQYIDERLLMKDLENLRV
jgi:hypothetical protein